MQKGYKGLTVYQKAYPLAVEIHKLTSEFPKEERYSLTDQIRRSSRSICANIAEGYRKRKYPKHFVSKTTDANSECSETQVWIDFSHSFGYLSEDIHKSLSQRCEEIGRMLTHMEDNPTKYAPFDPKPVSD